MYGGSYYGQAPYGAAGNVRDESKKGVVATTLTPTYSVQAAIEKLAGVSTTLVPA